MKHLRKHSALLLVLIALFVVALLIPLDTPRVFADSGLWSTPIQLSSNTAYSYSSIATDASGNVHVVWTDQSSPASPNIFYMYWNGSSWSNPMLLNTGIMGPDSLAADNIGRLHLIYIDPSTSRLNYRRFDGISWTPSIPISQETGTLIQWPSIAIGPSNNPHVVWPYSTTGNDSIVYYSSLAGGVWSVPQALTDPTGYSYQSRIVVDNNGVAHVVWADYYAHTVYYREFNGNMGTSPELLSGPGAPAGDPDIALDTAGNVHVVWDAAIGGPSQVYHTHRDGGKSWSTPANVSNSTFGAGTPSLASDPNNHIHLVWESGDIFYKTWDGAAWSASPDTVSQNLGASSYPAVAVNAAGAVHVSWLHNGAIFYSSTNSPPVARFTMTTTDQVVSANEDGQLNLTVSQGFNSTIPGFFSAQRSTDPDGDPLTYEWLYDGNTVGVTRDISPTLSEGIHSVTLKVTDGHGNQSTAQGVVNITARINTQVLDLAWPFISTVIDGVSWNNTAGNAEASCGKQGSDHCGDDWFAQDWNWGSYNLDWGLVLLSPATGRVIFTSTCKPNCPIRTYGQQVIIQNLDAPPYDYAVRFTHLEEVWVTDGQMICPGTPVGLIGYTGLTNQGQEKAHLHAAAYMGLFQNSAKGSTGYHWLDTNGSSLETLSLAGASRFAIRFNFNKAAHLHGCGDTFAIEGRVVSKQGGGLGGVTITVNGPQGITSSTTFGDDSGHYAVNGLARGNYTITPSKTNCTFTPLSATFSITGSHVEVPTFKANEAKCK